MNAENRIPQVPLVTRTCEEVFGHMGNEHIEKNRKWPVGAVEWIKNISWFSADDQKKIWEVISRASIREKAFIMKKIKENNELGSMELMIINTLPSEGLYRVLEIFYDLFDTRELLDMYERLGYDVNHGIYSDKHTLLHLTIAFLRFDFARLLIEQGADINIINAYGSSPLSSLKYRDDTVEKKEFSEWVSEYTSTPFPDVKAAK